MALEAGADALGFVFHPGSPRSIDAARWLEIRDALPPFTYCVAVFSVGDEAFIPEILALGGFEAFQLHGSWPREIPLVGSRTFFRSFDPDRDDLSLAEDFLAGQSPTTPSHRGTRALLLDPRRGALSGGTGDRATEEGCRRWIQRYPDSVLAGGLDPENIAGVVRELRPRAVDASSRLEIEPGRKDPDRVRAFVRNAKEAHEASR